MRTIPAEVVLAWPTPNYDDPVTRGSALMLVNAIFIGLVVITVFARLWTRLFITRWFGLDDIFIVLALLFTVGLAAVVLLGNHSYGWDRHVYDIPFNKLQSTLKIAMAAKVLFVSASTFTRLSLLCLYYRLVQDSGKRLFRWAVHFNVALTVAIYITFLFLAIFQCRPIRIYWMYGAPENTCVDEAVSTMAAGVINCIADLLCTVTPIPLVMKLQMPQRQRIAVVVLFSLGFVVTIAGIVRTWFIYKSFYGEYDLTWYSYPLWISGAVEIDLGTICASAPVLRPLFAKIPFRFSTVSSSVSTKVSSSDGSCAKNSPNGSGTTLQNNPIRSSYLRTLTDSKRRSQTIKEETESEIRQAEGYELNQMDDLEKSLRHSCGSQEFILGGEAVKERESWDTNKWRKKRLTLMDLNTRGITSTSEEDATLQLTNVSTRSSDVRGGQ